MRAKQITSMIAFLAAGLVGWNGLVGPRIPPRWHVAVNAALGGLLVAATRAPLGLRPPSLWSGLRLGLAGAAPVVIGVAASTALSPVRVAMAERDLPGPAGALAAAAHPGRHGLVGGGRVPRGTGHRRRGRFRPRRPDGSYSRWRSGCLRPSPTPAAPGESVAGTVLVTGIAGWLFAWLPTSGQAAWPAPTPAHLAINEAGAVAALAVQGSFTAHRRGSQRDDDRDRHRPPTLRKTLSRFCLRPPPVPVPITANKRPGCCVGVVQARIRLRGKHVNDEQQDAPDAQSFDPAPAQPPAHHVATTVPSRPPRSPQRRYRAAGVGRTDAGRAPDQHEQGGDRLRHRGGE